MDTNYVSARLPRELHRQLKLAAVYDGVDLDAMLTEAVEQYLIRRRGPSYTQTRAASDHIKEPNEE